MPRKLKVVNLEPTQEETIDNEVVNETTPTEQVKEEVNKYK